VALTALEGSLRATFKLTLLKNGSAAIPSSNSDNLVTPFAETEKFWIPIGLDEDLDLAMKMAVRESISFLSKQFGLERRLIYAYLSAAVDYEVSQVVDKTKGIHGLVPKADFSDYIALSLATGRQTVKVIPVGGIFYLPASDILVSLGLKHTVRNNVITVSAPAGEVKMSVDSNKYTVGKQSIYLDAAPLNTKDGLILPVRVVSEILGVSVNWSTEGRKVTGQSWVSAK
jgi:hypothetical protein